MSTNGAWDTAKAGGWTLSNSDRTASSPAAGNQVRSTDSHTTGSAGKFYVEIVWTHAGAANDGVFLDTNGVGAAFYFWNADGSAGTDINGNQPNQGWGSGNTLQFALDCTNSLLWTNVNNGNWNNSGTANPATGVGGIVMTTAQALFLGATGQTSADIAVIDGTTPTFAFAVPSGFSPWFASAVVNLMGQAWM